MTFNDLPRRAQYVLIGFASAHELDTMKLLDQPKTKREKRLRYELWKALRSEVDCRGEPIWSLREIASWFGVAYSHVRHGLRQVGGDKVSLTPSRVACDPK